MVGGGSRNVRLCQMTADATGKKVVTGGKESTSLGNLGAQLKSVSYTHLGIVYNIFCDKSRGFLSVGLNWFKLSVALNVDLN